jgi:SAM-dependent methyltransferase
MKIPYSIRFSLRDFWRGLFCGTLGIQFRLRKHLKAQNRSWPKEKRYTQGYFYQGLEELGITGGKPTGFRFAQYQVDDILNNADVLDIGSNAGFVACYCAKKASSVTAVELNPFMNRIAKDAADYLHLKNIDIVDGDFSTFITDRKFDVVLSLSNHHTIDGNLHMGFEHYIEKIAALLKPDGYLLFESHNVFASGSGGVGDDGDMEQKVYIMNKHFDIERYRMVHCYLKHAVEDLDKLFIVARRSNAPKQVKFNLPEARNKYQW